MIIHLGSPLPMSSSDATRRLVAGRDVLRCRRKPSYSVLLQLGFTKPRSHPRAGELLPHRFTVSYPFRQVVFFSVALSADHSAPPLTANLPYEVPTFLSGVTLSDHALNFSLLGTLLSGPLAKPPTLPLNEEFVHSQGTLPHLGGKPALSPVGLIS